MTRTELTFYLLASLLFLTVAISMPLAAPTRVVLVVCGLLCFQHALIMEES